MKKIFLFLLWLPSYFLFAQTSLDSVLIKQVDSLIQLSRDITKKNEYDKALEVNSIAEKIAIEKFGKESESFGSCCHNHGRVLFNKGAYSESEKWFLEAIKIREKALGKDHPQYAQSLNILANLYTDLGNYEKAEPLYLEAQLILEHVFGKENLKYAANINDLGILYKKMCNYEKAEPLLVEQNAILEKFYGKDHPDYASSLLSLAEVYSDLGKFAKAESLYLEAKEIDEKTKGKDDPDYAITLLNLGIFYKNLGNNEKAEQFFLHAVAIDEKTIGKEHPDYAKDLWALANLYYNIGNFKKAELIYLEVKKIVEKLIDKDNPEYASILHNLANVYAIRGYFDKAESLYLESKSIREKTLGKMHSEYAQSLTSLGTLYEDLLDYEKAEQLFLEAKAIREKVFGNNHPDYAYSLNNLVKFYLDIGNYEKAVPLQLELCAVDKTILEKSMHHMSERELNNFVKEFSERQNLTISLLNSSNGEKVASVCYDNSLFYKGFLLNATDQIRHLALSDTNSYEKFNLLKSYELRVANEYSKPLLQRDSLKLARLEEKANTIEKDLTRTVLGFGNAIKQINWKEVQSNLKQGEAAIEFVHYRLTRKKLTDSTMYSALLLIQGANEPKFISLFEEKQLDSLLKRSGGLKADYVNNLYSFAQRGAIAIDQPQRSLYDLLWKSLESNLKDVKTIYYSPTGLLHRLNLGAIAISTDETLGDKYQLIQLKSTRQLAVLNTSKIFKDDAILFGGIEFDLDSTALINDLNGDIVSRSRSTNESLGFENVDTRLRVNYPIFNADLEKKHVYRKEKKYEIIKRGGAWNFLPGTEKEVSLVEKILLKSDIKVTTKKGYEATEEVFKNIGQNGIPSPRILHIATHGYFFPDPKTNAKDSSSRTESEPVFKISEHPMLRSGLILAGGNDAWQGKNPNSNPREGHEDGILTAYEISQMNLSNTELVVLSACETGLGDIQGNEGVYGLQRAFKIAGAKYIVMSLWQVPDKQTSELMKSFYQKWLVEKMSLPDAFRSAQKDMQDRFVDPYAWAGFVLVE